jgi:hypothetical protein
MNRMKPALLFITDPHSNYDPRVIRNYYNSIITILEYDFNVVLYSEALCDYQAITDKYLPDIVLFDSGQEELKAPIQVTNSSANKHIPKIGLLSCDSHDPGIIRVLDRFSTWGIQYSFAIDSSLGEVLPYFQENLFYLPWSIDPSVFYNRECDKIHEVSLLGAGFFGARGRYPTYPWRAEVAPHIISNFPTFVTPRPTASKTHRVQGSNYAQVLSQSKFTLGCGGIKNILVRKLIEIPAAGCCLVTKETEIIKQAGFEDGRNCIFATHENIVEKLNAYFSNEDKLNEIVQNGCTLAHQNHTHAHRKQIYSLFEILRNRKTGKKIIQKAPFDSLQQVDTASDDRTLHIQDNNYFQEKKALFNDLFFMNTQDLEKKFRRLNEVFSNNDTAIIFGLLILSISDNTDEISTIGHIDRMQELYNKMSGGIQDPVFSSIVLFWSVFKGQNTEFLDWIQKAYNHSSLRGLIEYANPEKKSRLTKYLNENLVESRSSFPQILNSTEEWKYFFTKLSK